MSVFIKKIRNVFNELFKLKLTQHFLHTMLIEQVNQRMQFPAKKPPLRGSQSDAIGQLPGRVQDNEWFHWDCENDMFPQSIWRS